MDEPDKKSELDVVWVVDFGNRIESLVRDGDSLVLLKLVNGVTVSAYDVPHSPYAFLDFRGING